MDKTIKINKLVANEKNPRIIKDSKFKKLVESIKEFPEMLKLRPIVVDEDMVILGGNMRYKASIEAGLKEVPVKIAKGLTQEQKNQFIIKDNVGFGDWDWAMIANEWNTIKITEWGLDVWENQDDRNDMPEFDNKDLTPKRQLIISFRNEDDIKTFANLIKQNITDKTKSLWYPEAVKEKQFDKLYTDES